MPILDLEARRAYNRRWVRNRREQWIRSQGGSCTLCGSTDRLEVDHVDRATKSMNPASIWGRNAAARAAELAKCQVLCFPCHQAKTSSENRIAVHGSHAMYQNNKCRCDLCRAGHARLAREYRARIRLAS